MTEWSSQLRRRRFTGLIGLCVSTLMLATGCGGTSATPPAPAPTTAAAMQEDPSDKPPSTIFGAPPSNPFLIDIGQRPVHQFSEYWMKNIRGQMSANQGVVPINAHGFNSSFYIADSSTPGIRVQYHNCQNKQGIPSGLFDGPGHFLDVPVPAGALPAKGTDGALSIWSPSRDQLWEFWIMRPTAAGGWEACWGGRIDHASASGGAFPPPYGSSASGLATVGSMITIDEARAGRIDHAMNIGLKAIASEQTFVAPARRSDGKDTSVSAVPMGTRLRLDPAVNVDSLQLTLLGKAVAKAAQRYGFIVTESSGVAAVGAESGLRDEKRTGTDPWAAILGDVPDYQQLQNFPWDRVQVVTADG